MAVREIYSKRLKRERGEVPEVYRYDQIPKELVVQLIHIFRDTIGNHDLCYKREDVAEIWGSITRTLNREYGSFTLNNFTYSRYDTSSQEFEHFMLSERNADRILDGAELALCAMYEEIRDQYYRGTRVPEEVIDNFINEANQRFLEHGLGYRFEGGKIFRIDSEFIHAEITKPALFLLQDEWCAGAEQEFYKAHEHYRRGNYKEALNECLKSFESMLKSVCLKNGWEIDDRATANTLIQVCLDNELIPKFWLQHFNSLRSSLESGVPTGRNRMSGHGQGSEPTNVPQHIVSYMLNLTAACLVFIHEADKQL